MEDPKLYELGNGIQHSDSLEIISKYLPLLKSRNTGDVNALDIGCGSGNVTWEILHSLLPSNVRLFGSDVESRMVEFAATKYPELKTFVLDIGTYKLPGHLREAFDYVFSFYCLMWIKNTNTRQAMQNIYNILKPGGQFFTHYLVSHCFFETFHKLSIMEKWENHVPNNRLVQNFYNFEEENVNDKVRNILENVGFKISICRIEFKQAEVNNMEELKNTMAAVLPGYPKVPDNLKEELMNDAVEILFQHEIWRKMNQKSSNKFIIPYSEKMEDPKLYELGNGIQYRDSLEIIPKYLPLLKSRNTGDVNALDIGCGSGNVTWEILHSLLPSNVRLFGSDVEPRMVEFAATKYPELKTFVLDIGTYKLPGHLREAFDYVFSFYCLMWIRDKDTRQAMQNIYNILKPGGQFFTHFLVSHCFFETFHKLSIMEKWENHVPNNRLVQNFYNFEEENVNDKVRTILENVGFKISICRIDFRQAVLNNMEELKNTMAAVLPGYPKVPDNLKEELMNDAVEILFQHEIWRKMNQKSSNKFIIPYRLIIILATKPK